MIDAYGWSSLLALAGIPPIPFGAKINITVAGVFIKMKLGLVFPSIPISVIPYSPYIVMTPELSIFVVVDVEVTTPGVADLWAGEFSSVLPDLLAGTFRASIALEAHDDFAKLFDILFQAAVSAPAAMLLSLLEAAAAAFKEAAKLFSLASSAARAASAFFQQTQKEVDGALSTAHAAVDSLHNEAEHFLAEALGDVFICSHPVWLTIIAWGRACWNACVWGCCWSICVPYPIFGWVPDWQRNEWFPGSWQCGPNCYRRNADFGGWISACAMIVPNFAAYGVTMAAYEIATGVLSAVQAAADIALTAASSAASLAADALSVASAGLSAAGNAIGSAMGLVGSLPGLAKVRLYPGAPHNAWRTAGSSGRFFTRLSAQILTPLLGHIRFPPRGISIQLHSSRIRPIH
jgi:hypothetical protein